MEQMISPGKPKLTVKQQIQKLKDLGITFLHMSDEEAENFLSQNTYLFKLKSYMKNYPKNLDTEKYVNLDFAYLVELSTLDTHFRNKVMDLCLSIEHQLKVRLIRDLTSNPCEDGYSIIQEIFTKYPRIKEEIKHRKVCESRVLCDKYYPNMPVWVFVEVCTFGSLIQLLNHYYRKYPDKKEETDSMLRLVYAVRFLRNAAAHSNCLLNSLREPYTREKTFHPNRELQKYLQANGFSKNSQSKKLNNPLSHDFAAALKLFSMICTSERMYQAVIDDFLDLFHNRFCRHQEYFENYQLLTSYYEYAVKLLAIFRKER